MPEKPPEKPNVIEFPKERVSEAPLFEGEDLRLAVMQIHRLDKNIINLREESAIVREALDAPTLGVWQPEREPLKMRVLRKLAGRPQTKTEIRKSTERMAARSPIDRDEMRKTLTGGKDVVGIENELADLMAQREALEKRLPADVGEKLLAMRKEREEGYEKLGRKLASVQHEVTTTTSESGPEQAAPSLEFEQLKKQFDWVNPDYASAHFEPIEECRDTHETATELVHFGKNISTEEALKELNKRGLRPATVEELLAYARANPEEQRKYPIVALGSVALVGGRRSAAYLWRGGAERYLRLDWLGGGWSGYCRFLAARK